MIIHLTSEVAPFYKRGGLGDVLGALPFYLSERGPNAVISFYYEDRMSGIDNDRPQWLAMDLQGIRYPFCYYHQRSRGVDFYFINLADAHLLSDLESGLSNKPSIDGHKPYQDTSVSYFVYLYFARAAMELMLHLQLQPRYLIFHDWHVCGCFAFPSLLDQLRAQSPFTTLLLIHNYEHQGDILPDAFEWLDEEAAVALAPLIQRHGAASLLALGMHYADHTATVSNGYADELRRGTAPHAGLGFIRALDRPVLGLLNGIDSELWSPRTSAYLEEPYDEENAAVVKKTVREALKKELGLEPVDVPLVLMMARLTEQKGITLLIDSWSGEEAAMAHVGRLLDAGVQIVVCGHAAGGTGGSIYTRLSRVAERFAGRFAYIPDYSEAWAHRLLAASDAVLCPSLYEPCGLVHLYGMSFGSVPVVRPVGGLRDTVQPYDRQPDTATGFYIADFSCESLLDTMRQLVQVYHDQPAWSALVGRCMEKDFSWERARLRYFRLFDAIEAGEEMMVK